jgi:thiamine transporter ThiT
LKLLTTAKVYGVAQALLDYPAAYGAAGFCAALLPTAAAAALAGCLARFALHTASGVIYFNSSVAASLAVNGAYMVPVTLLTVSAVAALERERHASSARRAAGGGEIA